MNPHPTAIDKLGSIGHIGEPTQTGYTKGHPRLGTKVNDLIVILLWPFLAGCLAIPTKGEINFYT